MRAADLAT
jgi:hypothetical protein